MEDVTSGFDWIRSTWTVKAFSWEKSSWFVIVQVALAHNEFECLKCLIHGLFDI